MNPCPFYYPSLYLYPYPFPSSPSPYYAYDHVYAYVYVCAFSYPFSSFYSVRSIVIHDKFKVFFIHNILKIIIYCIKISFTIQKVLHTLLTESLFGLCSSGSFLNIPGSKPTGPGVPMIPGNDAELSL